jgi:hypothetical protein
VVHYKNTSKFFDNYFLFVVIQNVAETCILPKPALGLTHFKKISSSKLIFLHLAIISFPKSAHCHTFFFAFHLPFLPQKRKLPDRNPERAGTQRASMPCFAPGIFTGVARDD